VFFSFLYILPMENDLEELLELLLDLIQLRRIRSESEKKYNIRFMIDTTTD
jgi:hypothetical protein